MADKHPDRHRKAIVEHTLHILFLPGIHLDTLDQWFFVDPSESPITPLVVAPYHPRTCPNFTVVANSLYLILSPPSLPLRA